MLEPRDALAIHHSGSDGNSGLQLIVAELDTPAFLAWVNGKSLQPPLTDAPPSQIDVGDAALVGLATKAARGNPPSTSTMSPGS